MRVALPALLFGCTNTAPSAVCDWVLRCDPSATCASYSAPDDDLDLCLADLDGRSCDLGLPAVCDPLVRTGEEVGDDDTAADGDSGG